MADECFKSALLAHYSSVFHDSSLALPAEPTPRSASKVGPNDRSLRVHQQVQLTLARRARNSGKVHLHVDLDAHICPDQAESAEEARLETRNRPLLFDRLFFYKNNCRMLIQLLLSVRC